MAQTPEKIYHVDPSFNNNIPQREFNNLQSAIDQIPDYGRAKIIIYDNLMNVPTLVLTNIRTNITIDGLDTFGIYFTWGQPMFNIGERQTLKFRNMTYIRGDRVAIDNLGANLGFYDCQSVMCSLTLESGMYSNLYIHNTKFYGYYNNPAIRVNNGDVRVELFYSYLKGGYNYPAVLFSSDSDKKFKAKHSIIIHGSNNTPIELSGIYDVGVLIYDCASNKRICNNNLIAWVYENSCKSDLEITF